MEHEGNNEARLRKYLLGELNEADEQAFEERLLADEGFSDLLLAEEDELIDDYLSGELSAGERARFDGYFLVTPERRRNLSFGDALRSYNPVPDPVADPNPTPNSNAAPDPNPAVKPRPISDPKPVLQPWWKVVFSTPYIRLAAVTVIVLAVGLGSWRTYLYFQRPQMSRGMVALREAYPDQRPTESRITEWNYAPPPPVTRGPERDKFNYVALDRARALIQLEASEHPSAQSYHDLGRLYLAQGDFDKAIDQFEKTLRLDEKNAQVHSDYGAALLEIGKADRLLEESGKSLETFARSLEQLSTAIEIDGSLLEALFNRALCRQYMMLSTQAEDDWRSYLERDSNSKWADEAKQNLKQLLDQKQRRSQSNGDMLYDFLGAYRQGDDQLAWTIVSQSREPVSGRSVFHELVNSYLDPLLAQNEGKSAAQALNYLATLETKKSGDRYFSDLARLYSSASAAQRNVLAEAHNLMRGGYQEYVVSRFDESIASFENARNLFNRAGNVFEADYAECWIGRCYSETARARQSLAILQRLARACGERKHHWLLAQVLNALGSVHSTLNEYSAAIDDTGRALEVSEKMQDCYGKQKNLAQLAIEYKGIGNLRQALTFLHQALALASQSWSSSRQMWRTYDTAARVFTSMNLYTAAADYEREALQIASEVKDPSLMYVSYVHLGVVHGKLQQYSEAIKNAETGLEIAQSFSSQPARLDMMAYSCLQLGHLNGEAKAFDSAIAYYDRAIQLNHELNSAVDLYQAHRGKLVCYIAQESDALAKEEVATTLSLFEEHRSKIEEESDRNTFSDDQQNIYDMAIDFEYSRMKNPRGAFEHSEMSRARSLLDLTGGTKRLTERNHRPDLVPESKSKPLSLAQLQEKMPDQVQVIEYTALNDKVLMWVFTKTSFSVAEHSIPLDQLSGKVLRFLELVSRPDEGNREEMLRVARDLYNILMAPVQPMLDASKIICVVPDKVLNYLPFSALVSPTSGKYLVNDYGMVFCPSSNIFLVCCESARKKEGKKAERILSVGNPRFDTGAFPRLPTLPSSTREAETVASYYSSPCILVEENAREDSVKSEMEKSDVIHFASHYIIDERSPMLSKLILGRETAQAANKNAADGILQAYEIYGLDLQHVRLVVLSACQTGVERYYNGEGMIGMSRTFIVAGVPLIVGSLWAIDSHSSTELMISFHRYRTRGGLSTVEALKQAQLDMATGSEARYQHPYYWASFMAMGGYTTF